MSKREGGCFWGLDRHPGGCLWNVSTAFPGVWPDNASQKRGCVSRKGRAAHSIKLRNKKVLLLPAAPLSPHAPYLNGMEMSALHSLMFLRNQFWCLCPFVATQNILKHASQRTEVPSCSRGFSIFREWPGLCSQLVLSWPLCPVPPCPTCAWGWLLTSPVPFSRGFWLCERDRRTPAPPGLPWEIK